MDEILNNADLGQVTNAQTNLREDLATEEARHGMMADNSVAIAILKLNLVAVDAAVVAKS